ESHSCQVWLSLKPSSAGEKHANLVVQYAGDRPDDSLEVSGRAAAPQLAFSPGGYDFGLQPTSQSAYKTFELTNTGEAGVQFNGFEFVGPGQSAYWTNGSNCWGSWLEPGQSCDVEVGFGPRDPALFEAELRTSVSGTNFDADLRGEG